MGIFNSYRKNKENQSDTNSSKGNKPKLKEIKRTYSSADINSDININENIISENKNTNNKVNKKDNNEKKKDNGENKIIEKTNNENNNDINNNLKIDANIQNKKDINKNETSNKKVKEGKKTLSKSYSFFKNESDNIYTRPNYSILYDDMNIFKLILIMLNNISLVKKYFLRESAEKKIKLASEYFQKNCISFLTYYINKSLWYDEKTNVTDQDLVKYYNDYILYFTQKYCSNSNSDTFLKDEKNIEIILNSIYDNINFELTCAKKGKVNDNSINTNNKFDDFENFRRSLMEKNQSFLSDIFMGTYKFDIFCQECYRKTMTEKVQFKGSLRYETFYFVDFNFDEIKTFYIYIYSLMNSNELLWIM